MESGNEARLYIAWERRLGMRLDCSGIVETGNEARLYVDCKLSAVYHTPPLRLTYTRQEETSNTHTTGDDVS